MDAAGDLLAETQTGRPYGDGVIFELGVNSSVPVAAAAIDSTTTLIDVGSSAPQTVTSTGMGEGSVRAAPRIADAVAADGAAAFGARTLTILTDQNSGFLQSDNGFRYDSLGAYH